MSHPVFDELEGEGTPFSSYCFSDERGAKRVWAKSSQRWLLKQFGGLSSSGLRTGFFLGSAHGGFTPPDMINILGKTKLAEAEEIWGKMEKPAARDPLGRIMYHTFNSIMPWSGFSCRDAQFRLPTKRQLRQLPGGCFQMGEPTASPDFPSAKFRNRTGLLVDRGAKGRLFKQWIKQSCFNKGLAKLGPQEQSLWFGPIDV